MILTKTQQKMLRTIWTVLAIGMVWNGPHSANGQCYEFVSGTAADLKINISKLPKPTVTYAGSEVLYDYTSYGVAGNGATLTLGSSVFSSDDLPVLHITTLSFSSALGALSSAGFEVTFSDVGASVVLKNGNAPFFQNGLPPTLPPLLYFTTIFGGPGAGASLNVVNSQGTLQTLPLTAIANCNPSTVGLAPTTFIPTGSSAGGISAMAAATDFNSDGIVDLVTANLVNSTVTVLFGKGDGSFQAPVSYKVGQGPYGIVAGDLNGDGKPDIAVVNGLDNTIAILLNNKSGGFPASANYTYSVGSEPFGLSMVDLNKDGFQDLIVTNTASGNFGVLLGKGDGSFKPQVTYAAGTDPFGTAVADLNGDGYPDVVAWNIGSNSVGVYLNDKTGKFAAPVTYTTGSNPFSVSARDLNGDGYPDLAIANLESNTITVLLNDTTGKFLPGVTYATGALPASVLAADLNGDGELDLAVANLGDGTVSLLLGKGDGTFLPQTSYLAEDQPYSLLAADFNGDGKTDLAVTSFYNSTIGVLLQTSTTNPAAEMKTGPHRTRKPVIAP